MKFSRIIDAKKQPFQAYQNDKFDESLNILLDLRKPLSAHSETVVSSQATTRQDWSAEAFLLEYEMEFQPLSNHYKFIDLTNQTFTKLKVLGYLGIIKTKCVWLCQCECGKLVKACTQSLRGRLSKSCGCTRAESLRNAVITHGETIGRIITPEYRAYLSAKQRCSNSNKPNYKNYGGRGIQFKFNSFDEFLGAVGRKPNPEYSLDRIDNNGHYEKGNLRWATRLQQNLNSRHNRLITYKGKTQTISEWGKELNLHTSFIWARLAQSFCVECVFVLPKYCRCIHKGDTR